VAYEEIERPCASIPLDHVDGDQATHWFNVFSMEVSNLKSTIGNLGTGSFWARHSQLNPTSHSHRGFSPVKRAGNDQGNRFNGLSSARSGKGW